MKTRFDLYQAKSQQCKVAAEASDAAEKPRWLKLAAQWAAMAERAKPARKRRVVAAAYTATPAALLSSSS